MLAQQVRKDPRVPLARKESRAIQEQPAFRAPKVCRDRSDRQAPPARLDLLDLWELPVLKDPQARKAHKD